MSAEKATEGLNEQWWNSYDHTHTHTPTHTEHTHSFIRIHEKWTQNFLINFDWKLYANNTWYFSAASVIIGSVSVIRFLLDKLMRC